MSDKKNETKPDGMPVVKEDEKGGSIVGTVLFTIIPLLIGTAIAFAIYSLGSTEQYEKKMAAIAEAETFWVYLSLVVFGRAVVFVNFYPSETPVCLPSVLLLRSFGAAAPFPPVACSCHTPSALTAVNARRAR